MKDFRIDGKMKRVFVLKETKDRVVFIPLLALTRIDYNRLKEAEEKAGAAELLTELRNTTADNGRNLLALLDNIIEVGLKDASQEGVLTRMSKPNEKNRSTMQNLDASANPQEVKTSQPEEKKPARRKPGPKPKNKPAE